MRRKIYLYCDMEDAKIVIRVYGIYIDPLRGLLVSDEIVYGRKVTKFPGGGLEYGEGTKECLAREMIEETGHAFDVLDHFYTTDFFVNSVFHQRRQVISIYYRMKPVKELNLDFSSKVFHFDEEVDGVQSFRFIPVKLISPENFTLDIDKYVGKLLADKII